MVGRFRRAGRKEEEGGRVGRTASMSKNKLMVAQSVVLIALFFLGGVGGKKLEEGGDNTGEDTSEDGLEADSVEDGAVLAVAGGVSTSGAVSVGGVAASGGGVATGGGVGAGGSVGAGGGGGVGTWGSGIGGCGISGVGTSWGVSGGWAGGGWVSGTSGLSRGSGVVGTVYCGRIVKFEKIRRKSLNKKNLRVLGNNAESESEDDSGERGELHYVGFKVKNRK